MSGNYQLDALVIGATNWGEADKIITLLSAERGQVRALAFGCRRPKSPLAAVVQPFNRIEAVLTTGQKLETMRSAVLQHAYRKIGTNLAAMAYGSFVSELIRELVPEGEPAAAAFRLTEKVFAALENRNPRVVALAAAWQYLRLTGLAPDFSHCGHCGRPLAADAFLALGVGGAVCADCRKVSGERLPLSLKTTLENLYALDWDGQNKITFSSADFVAAEKILLKYLAETLDNPLKSLKFIRELY